MYFWLYGIAYWMPIQQKLPPPVLLFSVFAGWVIYQLSAVSCLSDNKEVKDVAQTIMKSSFWRFNDFNTRTFLSLKRFGCKISYVVRPRFGLLNLANVEYSPHNTNTVVNPDKVKIMKNILTFKLYITKLCNLVDPLIKKLRYKVKFSIKTFKKRVWHLKG